jgi:hypothetical protein
LEQEVAQYKVDMTSLDEFKDFSFELQDELSISLRPMYSNLQEFQSHTTYFLSYLENTKDTKVVPYGVQLSMDELKKW